MRLSCPSSCSRTARLRTWSLTPPGDAKSYGETSPILMPRSARRAGPDPMRNEPLLGMALDEALDAAQQLLCRADLVGARVAGRLGVDQGRALRHVRIVRQPVHAHRKERSAETKSDRGRAERNRRQLAEKGHHVPSPCEVAVDRRDHHLLVAQSLQ